MLSYSKYNLIDDLTDITANTCDRSGIEKLFSINDISFNNVYYNSNNKDVLRTEIGKLVDEMLLNAGNTFVNIFRGWEGVSYIEMLCDVADKLDIGKDDLEKCNTIDEIDEIILIGTIKKYFKNLSEEERKEIFKKIEDKIGVVDAKKIAEVFMELSPTGLYAILSYVGTQAVRKAILEAMLYFAGRQAALNIARVATLAVPFLNIITGIWLALDISGPAYRKTIPSVILISTLRFSKQIDDVQNSGGF